MIVSTRCGIGCEIEGKRRKVWQEHNAYWRGKGERSGMLPTPAESLQNGTVFSKRLELKDGGFQCSVPYNIVISV